jgi:hypothetical protein
MGRKNVKDRKAIKVFRVELRLEILVVAENAVAAKEAARDAINPDTTDWVDDSWLRPGDRQLKAFEIRNESELPDEWRDAGIWVSHGCAAIINKKGYDLATYKDVLATSLGDVR